MASRAVSTADVLAATVLLNPTQKPLKSVFGPNLAKVFV